MPVVVIHGVVNRQRIHLHDLHVQIDIGEVLDVRVDQLAAHREDADFNIRRCGRLKKLVAPLHVVQGEGNLLDGLEADDLGNLLGLDRRQLDEAGKTGNAADADGRPRRPCWRAAAQNSPARIGSAIL
jgi:hypothetical protein